MGYDILKSRIKLTKKYANVSNDILNTKNSL